jgi:flagellar hook-basal body complex protein FliE
MTPISPITPSAASVLPFNALTAANTTPVGTTGIQMPDELAQSQAVTGTQPSSDSFQSMLSQMVSDVNSAQQTSAQTVGALQSGQNVPLHQAVIAMEEANVSFQLMVEVRNRMMDAYQEIMRMQI